MSCMPCVRQHIQLALVALVMAFSGSSYAQPNRGPYPELASTIVMYGPGDMLPSGSPDSSGVTLSNCERGVINALAHQQSVLMFEPTLFWYGANNTEESPQADMMSVVSVTHWCFQSNPSGSCTDDRPPCPEPTQENITSLQTNMTKCFKRAVDAGMDIAITFILNDGTSCYHWAPGLNFDPLEQYGSWTFEEFFVDPILNALKQTMRASTRVLVSAQGLNSAAVLNHPDSWNKTLGYMKDTLMTGAPVGFSRDYIQTGLMFNFDKLSMTFETGVSDPNQWLEDYLAANVSEPAEVEEEYDTEAIQQLFETSDFIGVQNRPALTADFSVEQLENATYQFEVELATYGVNLTQLLTEQNKSLYWMEFGVGGLIDSQGDFPATEDQAAENPWYTKGSPTGGYEPYLDPSISPSASTSPARMYEEYYYNQTVQYAQQSAGPNRNSSFRYQVSGIFLWDWNQFDVQGVANQSSNYAGSFLNPEISVAINNYNMWSMSQNRMVLNITQ